jgi:hypothetical protein
VRIDVAVVGFILFTAIGPLLGGYVAAWLIAGGPNPAFEALFGGGTDAGALAAAIGAGAGLGLTLRTAAGPVLDAFVGAWPATAPLATDPRRHALTFGRVQGELDLEEEGPVGLGSAVGSVGTLLGVTVLVGLAVAGWPAVDAAALDRVVDGTASAVDWLVAAFPAIARTMIAAVGGILGGAVWATMTSPVADVEP